MPRSWPFSMIRNWPVCWETNKRPSGASAIAVGSTSPLATTDSEKPGGKLVRRSRVSRRSKSNVGLPRVGRFRERLLKNPALHLAGMTSGLPYDAPRAPAGDHL